ncbi:MAG: DUF4093 domain-containing protein [Oscillospiraceae bacterium]|nr:DUF4093 domain-containing protein [Oscillospiraceae bacterium]
MIKIDRAVIVEGKYDKIKLSSVMEGVILCTDGFRIFKDKEKMKIIRHYAEKTGIIILTDSDTAGFKIRRYLKGAINGGDIINVYIPDIFGKERRKAQPSKEGKLGVEGMDEKTLLEAFEKAGVLCGSSDKNSDEKIDKMLLYELGYSGGSNCSERRRILLRHLDLPELMTTSAIADILNTMITPEELIKITEELFGSII